MLYLMLNIADLAGAGTVNGFSAGTASSPSKNAKVSVDFEVSGSATLGAEHGPPKTNLFQIGNKFQPIWRYKTGS